jgi:3-carboxy-cis,cis-muconate cycloisomerase
MAVDSTSASKVPAKPSSLPSESVFAGIYGRGEAAAAVSGEAWLQAMLDVEAALARACALEGLIPPQAGDAIAAACVGGRFDLGEISRDSAAHASPVVPLVRALRDHLGDEMAGYVHVGATSQDILDTAAMLVSRRALEPVLADIRAAARASASLADEHRATAMSARTLLQQALPTSFGLRAAGWLVGIDEAGVRLADVRQRELAVLMEPALPWHTIRVRLGALAGAVGTLAGVLAKVARDVTLLAQGEVGELREGGSSDRGGSTAMAHKHNPVAAVSVLACARRVPGLVAAILASMEQEHERAAGAWQAEWGTLSDLLALGGSAASWTRELLEHLEVNPARMRENLARLAASGVPEAADPDRHLGAASELIERALAATRG